MTYQQRELFNKIEKCLLKNPSLRLQDLARRLGCSDRTIEKIIRKYSFLCFREYKKRKVLQTTKSMLKQGYRVKEIGFEIGYKWPNNFSRFIRRSEGSSISESNQN